MTAVAHYLKTVSKLHWRKGYPELRASLGGADTDWSSGKQLTEQFLEDTEG